MERHELAAAMYNASHLVGSFRLRSGRTATEYFDKYQFESDPRLLQGIAEAAALLIPPDTEVLAGLELGGIPVATAIGHVTGLPVVFVRKTAKEYGTQRLAEGTEIRDRTVLVVEDVVTSGGQIAISTADLRALGAHVHHALCMVDREEGGAALLADSGLSLIALFTAENLRTATR